LKLKKTFYSLPAGPALLRAVSFFLQIFTEYSCTQSTIQCTRL